MTKQRSLGIVLVLMWLVLPAACEQTFRTGKVGNTTNAPNPDGTCTTGLTVCGKGAFAQCLDLQTDREHCGTCDNACVAGIACAAGICQQIACTGEVPVSTQTISGSTPVDSASTYGGAILADINGDGRPDLVSWREESGDAQGTFQVALGEAGGGFGAASTYQAANAVDFIVAGSSNSDGFQDLYVSAAIGAHCVEIWLGHADGKLTPATDTGIPECMGSIAIGDLNGDGETDLVTILGNTYGPTVFLADANGAFHVGTTYPALRGASRILVRDWNGDGFPDLVLLSHLLTVYLNMGNGTFEDGMDCGVSTPEPKQVVIEDFNRDKHMDVAAGMGNSVAVLLGMGGCEFQPMAEYPLSASISALVQGDLNGDGIEDLVAQTSDGNISLLRGEADRTFQVVLLSTGSVPGESPVLLVGEVTGDGKADIVFVPGTAPIQIEIAPDGGIVRIPWVATANILENACQ